ncbi:hypothetical protein [Deinococcus sp. 12RED42]|uniref:hypothetical protein n=1 Tax=Deinococcus sp. 12RED42 TaxID=2745872 RepID=UPI001E511CA8|nr:hypothetical protein [Deinococcus sp. 12RED42]MCD0165092.1 hypothetical protein [Deinococcus sp. 12RED42]
MKKLLLMMAALNLGASTALAAGQSASVTLSPTVTVSNVCATTGNLNLDGFNDTILTYPTMDYNALDGDGGGTETPVVEFWCTAGTALSMAIAASGPNSDSQTAQSFSNSVTTAYTGDIFLNGTGSNLLKAKYRVTINPNASSGVNSADKYKGKVKFTAPDGQWGVPAGVYSGTLAMTISYN